MFGELNESLQTEFSTSFAKPEEELLKEFRKYKPVRKKLFYYQTLSQIKISIIKGEISQLQKINALLVGMEKELNCLEYRSCPDNPLRNVNIIILTCKYNQYEILDFIFSNSNKILQHMPVSLGENAILPTDIDECQHNAFYYAMRSGDTKIVKILIEKWPNEYPFQRFGKLCVALTNAYRELKLKNVELTNDIEFLVREIVFNENFHSDGQTHQEPDEEMKKNITNHNGETQNTEDQFKIDVAKRIELVLSNIRTLTQDYGMNDVDETFLVIAKFITKNIHVLKGQLRLTYDKIPWEEIEFCLVIFIMTVTESNENHLLHARILSKKKLLSYLENFAECLENTQESISKENSLRTFPNLDALKSIDKELGSCRSLPEACKLRIVKVNPLLEDLYKDYAKVRDEYSLILMRQYLELAISVKCDETGIIVISRALQVVGEHIKNTLESPKLSETTGELLLSSLPRNTKTIVKDLRDSLSHARSMSRRMEIETGNEEFFKRIQDDLKKLNTAIVEVLCQSKIRLIRYELKKICECRDDEELKEVFKSLHLENAGEMFSEIPVVSQLKRMEILVRELSMEIPEKTEQETALFDEISREILKESLRLGEIKRRMIMYLNSYNKLIVKRQQKDFGNMKNEAKRLLNETFPEIVRSRMSVILVLSQKILNCVAPKLSSEKLRNVKYLHWQLFYSGMFEIGKIKIIDEYECSIKEKRRVKLQPKILDDLLSEKITKLKTMLDSDAFKDIISFKSNRKFQVIVEMLVVDIYSLLDEDLSYNHLFLDAEPVILIGRNMRNHLAHENTINKLSSHTLIDLALNAKKIVEHYKLNNRRKIGNILQCNINKLQIEHEQDLSIISLQKEMYMALSNGDLGTVNTTLQKGADIKARNMRQKTALHFASEGDSIDTIKFVLDAKCEFDAEDANGQSALHIAAHHGKSNAVEYLIRNANFFVDHLDRHKKNPLHIAAEHGHLKVVKVLINSGASTDIQDLNGFSPLHYSIKNNHGNIVKELIEFMDNAIENDAFGGQTPLHIASRYGHLEIVKYLISKDANENAKTDTCYVPLHVAVQGEHLEVASSLIENGAKVNARCMEGTTALHMASATGNESILLQLLELETNVDDVLNIFQRSPLTFAAENGNFEIVKLLLDHNAKVDLKDVTGKTALHFAAENGHKSIVEILTTKNASLSHADHFGCTAMHYAAYYGYTNIVNILIEHGGSIHTKDRFLVAPLNLAVFNGHLSITKALVDAQAEVNNADISNSTALHKCLEKQYLEMAILLIKSKANFHIPSMQFGITPFHLALCLGSKDTLEALVDEGADIKDIKTSDFTALHLGIINGDLEFIQYLIDSKCDVNSKSKSGLTALHLAVDQNNEAVIYLLIKNKSNLNGKGNNGYTPLNYAVLKNNKEILNVLIEKEAAVEDEGKGEPLTTAVVNGFHDVVAILLDKGTFDLNVRLANNDSLLATSLLYGHKKITEMLLNMKAGIDDKSNNVTPLYFVSRIGDFEMVKLLLEKGANPNSVSNKENLTPLYAAVTEGHTDIVEFLLQKGATKVDSANKSALQLAVECSKVEVVKFLLENKQGDANETINDNFSILHIASMKNNLEIVKCLVMHGANRTATSINGETPLITAAENGQKDIVEYFHNNSDKDKFNYPIALLLAIKNGHLDVTKYLVENCVDIFTEEYFKINILHISIQFNQKDIVLFFLNKGFFYNVKNQERKTPLQVAKDSDIKCALNLVKMLFIAIKRNKLVLLEDAIKKEAIINAKRKDNASPLHYATWKGHCNIVDALLKNGANPNIIGKSNSTPLHYAAKFRHFYIVRSLLSHGAIYNIQSESGKIPLDNSTNKDVTELLSLVDKSFRSVQIGDSNFLEDLKALKDPETIKSVMKSRNKDNKLLVNFAMIKDFPKIKELKQILKVATDSMYAEASKLEIHGRFSESLKLFEDISKRMTEVLGHDHPDTLDVKDKIGEVLMKQHDFEEALNVFDKNFRTRKDSLGDYDIGTLHTKRYLARTLHKLGQKSEALQMLQEVFNQQTIIFGNSHSDSLLTQFIMASMLEQEGKYEVALNLFSDVYELHKHSNGENHPNGLEIEAEKAMILINQRKYCIAIEELKHLYGTQTNVLGPNDPNTLRSLKNTALVYQLTGKYKKALKLYEKILKEEETTYGQDNVYFLTTLYSIGEVLVHQQKFLRAFKILRKCYNKGIEVLSPNHKITQKSLEKMALVKFLFSLEYGDVGMCVLEQMEKDIAMDGQTGLEESVEKESEMYWKLMKRNYPFSRYLPKGWTWNIDDLNSESFVDFVKDSSHFRAICDGDYIEETDSITKYVDKDVFNHMENLKKKISGIHMKFDNNNVI